jgi:alkaline phosphatase D
LTTTRFGHSVASFDPTDSSVLLWTRLEGGGEVAWEIARDPQMRAIVDQGTAHASAERDHTVTVDVDGLEPATTYWYRFRADGADSPTGRTQTLPAGPTDRFVLATVSCARFSVAPFGVYRAVAEREVDLVLHLGDYIYEDDGSKGPRDHDPPRTATTLDDYRRRIAQIRSDPDAQALHLRHPMVTIWDDHDLADNAWATGAKAHDDAEHGPWSQRVAAAAQARAEWLPARLLDPGDVETTWHSLAIGDLAELVLLDTRLKGRDQHSGDEGTLDLEDPARSLLGPDQRAWLRERVAEADAPWLVVASGVVVNEIKLPWPRPLRRINALMPNGYAAIDDEILHDDQWDGYPAERTRLAGWLADRGARGGRTVILSGDVHSSWAFDGPQFAGEPVAVEITTPAVSSAPMARARVPGMRRLLSRQANALDHVRYAELTARGYATLELTATAATATWWHVHPWAQDPTSTAEAAAVLRTDHAAWPPHFATVPAEVRHDGPGARTPVAEALPPRPDDLTRLRRRRILRLTLEIALPAAIAAGAAAFVARQRRR